MADHNTTKHFLMDILDFVSPKNVPTYNRAGQIVKNPNDMIPVATEGLGTTLRDAARGTLTGIAGTPGDISEAIRSFKTKHRNRAGQYVNPDDILGERYFPTSEELQNKLGYEQSVPLKLGQHIVAPMIGPGEIVKGIKATKDMPIGLSMIGEGSKLWKPTMEKAALKMEKSGAKPTEIREATGLVRGLDGHWRDELSDQFAKMKDSGHANFGELHKASKSGSTVKLKDVLEHQDLYDAYPHLRNIEIVTHSSSSNAKGAYYPDKNKISIAEDLTPEQAKSTLLHEITHDIQNFEGWNHGANSSEEIKKYALQKEKIMGQIEGINAQMKEASKAGDMDRYHELMAAREPLSKQYMAIDPYEMGIKDYINNAGEAEARLVQARMDLPPEELLKHFPYEYTGAGKGKYGLDIHPDEAVIPSSYPKTMNQPSESIDYRGEHKAPKKDDYHVPAHDLTIGGMYSDDIYGDLSHHYYGTGDKRMDRDTLRILKEARGNPDHEITVYRAVPGEYKDADINPGDWVTPNLDYAHQHGLYFDSHHILEKRVPARHIYTNADSIHEFGYDPTD